jgi:hypothetical protein
MSTMLVVDPGKTSCGLAAFYNAKLVRCAFISEESQAQMITAAVEWAQFDSYDRVVTEGQQVYPGARSNPNDLIPLAYVAGAITGCLIGGAGMYKSEIILPRVWTNGIPKDIRTSRVLAALTPSELDIFKESKCIKSKQHNILDAIGLGLYAVGRDLT